MGVFRKRSKGFGSTSNKGSETRLSHVHQDCKEEHNPVIMVADVDFLLLVSLIIGVVAIRSGASEMPCPRAGGRRTFPNVRWNMPGAVRCLAQREAGGSF